MGKRGKRDEWEEEEREAKIQVDRMKERQRERRKRRCWKERDHFLGSEPSVQFHVIRTFYHYQCNAKLGKFQGALATVRRSRDSA